jgi:hypothetical protein
MRSRIEAGVSMHVLRSWPRKLARKSPLEVLHMKSRLQLAVLLIASLQDANPMKIWRLRDTKLEQV